MSQSHPLSRIIRQAGKGEKNVTAEETLIKTDSDSGKVIRSRFTSWDYLSYIVNHKAFAEGGISVRLKDFTRNTDIRIAISYQAACPSGSEEQLAQALSDKQLTPGVKFDKLVQEWLNEEGKRGLELLISEYLQDRSRLPERLRERAAREMGLQLQVRLQIEEETQLRTINLGPLDVTVRMKDHSGEQHLTLTRLPLEVDDRQRALAVMYTSRNQTLEKTVEASTQDYFASQVTLQAFHTMHQNESIRQGLLRQLNEALKPVGRVIRTLFFDHKASDHPVPPSSMSRTVSCVLQQGNITLQVSNNVHLTLRDLARYREQGSRETDRWLNDSFQQIVREELQYAVFARLLADFQPCEEKIRNRMDATARSYGYDIRQALTLIDKSTGQVLPTLQLQLDVPCRVPNYTVPIQIENSVHLSLSNVGRYREKGLPVLDKWLDENLKRITDYVLFGITYIDLLLNFAPREEDIKQRLKLEAEDIGYEIRQLIAIPNLPPIKWKEPFTIEPEGTFETIRSGVNIKLQVVVTARINDLRKVEPWLNSHQDVPELMKESVIRCLRSYIHGLDPARFYTQFYAVGPDSADQPVEKEIEALVREELKKYHPEIIDLIAKPQETELTERLRSLLESPIPIDFAVTPLGKGEKVFFSGKLQIEGVLADQWHKLQQRKYQLSDVKESVERYLVSRLSAMHYQDLVYKHQKSHALLETEMTRLISICAKDEFGLDVSFGSLNRLKTELEQQENELNTALYRKELEVKKAFLDFSTLDNIEAGQAMLEELRTLRKRRLLLITQPGNEDELEELDTKIEKKQKQLPAATLESIESSRFFLLPDKNGKTNLGQNRLGTDSTPPLERDPLDIT